MRNIQTTPLTPLADSQSVILMLCRGLQENGAPFWAYMAMQPRQAELYYDARARGAISLYDYGTVLESGEGVAPPDEVKHRMRSQFGIRDDYEEVLLKLMEQLNKNS